MTHGVRDRPDLWSKLKVAQTGLVPVITVSDRDGEVLMLAYMDEEAFGKTMETGLMHYHSRSRNQLWLKGETSGNVQRVVSARVDCDADTLLFRIDEAGPACHTGRRTCFYRTLDEL